MQQQRSCCRFYGENYLIDALNDIAGMERRREISKWRRTGGEEPRSFGKDIKRVMVGLALGVGETTRRGWEKAQVLDKLAPKVPPPIVEEEHSDISLSDDEGIEELLSDIVRPPRPPPPTLPPQNEKQLGREAKGIRRF